MGGGVGPGVGEGKGRAPAAGLCSGVGEGQVRVLPVSGISSLTADYPISTLFQFLVRFLAASIFLPLPSSCLLACLKFGFRMYPPDLHYALFLPCLFSVKP
jgi:hypothetical protein